jgi:hypothetical protein
MKKILLASALSLAFVVASLGQGNVVSTNLPISTLTNVLASTTTNAPITCIITANNYDEIGIVARFKIAATDANTTRGIFTFAREWYGTNDFDTSPLQQLVLTITNNGTAYAVGSTNFYMGAFPKLRLVSIQNASTQAMSAVEVRAIYKGRRNGL